MNSTDLEIVPILEDHRGSKGQVVEDHHRQALFDALNVEVPTPERPFASVTRNPQEKFMASGHASGMIRVGDQQLRGNIQGELYGNTALLAQIMAASQAGSYAETPKGDPYSMMSRAITSGTWSRLQPPHGTSEQGLRRRIAKIMNEEGAGMNNAAETAKMWAVADRADPICTDLKVSPEERDMLIALAARGAISNDRFGLAPPMSGTALVDPNTIEYGEDKDQIFLVHGDSKMDIVGNPGLANLVWPRWCIRADITALVPGIKNAKDMVGVPWATLKVSRKNFDPKEWSVWNPSDRQHKSKEFTATVDACPRWRYDPVAIERMLIAIHSASRREGREDSENIRG
jgi:hypothetical protein